MEIKWTLHNQDEIDPEDPVGDILITSDGTFIEERDTFIDSWLEALIAALRNTRCGKAAVLDIWEESESLIAATQGTAVRLSYGGDYVFVENIDEFARALQVATKTFVDQMNSTGRLTDRQVSELRKRLENAE